MDEIKGLRERIDEIDQQIVELFEKRMVLCKRVGEEKKRRGLDVRDSVREEEKLARAITCLSDTTYREEVQELMTCLLSLGRKVQGK